MDKIIFNYVPIIVFLSCTLVVCPSHSTRHSQSYIITADGKDKLYNKNLNIPSSVQQMI